MSWPIFTMSKVSGALYSTLTPMSLPPWSTPFLKIDQNGSDAWPWVTTSMRMLERFAPPPDVPEVAGVVALQAPSVSAATPSAAMTLRSFMPVISSCCRDVRRDPLRTRGQSSWPGPARRSSTSLRARGSYGSAQGAEKPGSAHCATSLIRTMRCSLTAVVAASETRRASTPSRAVHGLASSPRATRRKAPNSAR